MTRFDSYPPVLRAVTLSNGCRVSYLEAGTGPETLVLIHGLGTGALSWMKNLQGLSASFRCIALDLPGNGQSDDAPGGTYSLAFFARCVIDFIGKLGLSDVTLGGHSMGGQIALTAVLNEPRCADRLLLVAPAGFETFTHFERQAAHASFQLFDLFRTPDAALRDALEQSFWRMPPDARSLIQDLVQRARNRPSATYKAMIDACIRGMLQEPVYDRLHQIQQPALVLFGAYDALIPNRILHPGATPERIGQQGVSAMPDAQLQVLPSAGHFVHWEAAPAVNRLIENWC